MRLLPYLYSLAWEAHTRGVPLMRPLALHYPTDPNVWELGYQYLLGADLLVAPVTRAGGKEWPVYLPTGDWFDFWTGERHAGGRAISAATPLETAPVYARGGSIIPLGPVMQRTDERPLDELTLLVYPGGPGTLSLYEDDGATQAYRSGQHALTNIQSTFDDGVARVDIGPVTGAYAGQPDARDLTVRVWSSGRPGRVQATRDGRQIDVAASTSSSDQAATAAWWFEEPTWTVVRLSQVCRTERVTVELSS